MRAATLTSLQYFLVVGILSMAVLLLGFVHPLLPLLVGIGGLFALLFFHNPYWGILLLILTIPFGQFGRIPLGQQGAQEIPLMFTDALIPLLFFTWVCRKILLNESIKIPRFSFTIIGFTAVALLSIVHALTLFERSAVLVGGMYLIRWILFSLVFFIASDQLRTEKKIKKVLWLFFGSGVVLGILGLLQYLIFPDFSFMVEYGWDPHLERVVSTFFDPNFAGMFFVLAFGILFALWSGRSLFSHTTGTPISSSEKKQVIRRSLTVFALAGSALVLGLALVLTYSRSSLLALGIVLIFIGLLKDKRILFFTLVMGFVVVVAFPRIQERFVETFDYQTSAFKRLDSWGNAFIILDQTNPLIGIGYNTYRQAQIDFDLIEEEELARSGAGTDSSILLVLVTTGVVGVGLFLLLFFQAGIRGLLQFAYGKNLLGMTGLVFAASLVALFVHSQFVNSLLYPFLLLYFWIILAIVAQPLGTTGDDQLAK